jgi:hypothetical protein
VRPRYVGYAIPIVSWCCPYQKPRTHCYDGPSLIDSGGHEARMIDVLLAVLCSLNSRLKTRAALQVEVVALRHQINILRRSASNDPDSGLRTESSGLGWRASGPIGARFSFSSNPTPSSHGIARVSVCFGLGRVGTGEPGDPRWRKTSAI